MVGFQVVNVMLTVVRLRCKAWSRLPRKVSSDNASRVEHIADTLAST